MLAERDIVEGEFGEALDWQELTGKKTWRIAADRHDVDPADEAQWEDFHSWMRSRIDRFRRVFGARVKDLQLSAAATAEEDEEALAE